MTNDRIVTILDHQLNLTTMILQLLEIDNEVFSIINYSDAALNVDISFDPVWYPSDACLVLLTPLLNELVKQLEAHEEPKLKVAGLQGWIQQIKDALGNPLLSAVASLVVPLTDLRKALDSRKHVFSVS